ncbi:TMV resistance protein N-like [Trifolium pratense]|uniref:TMV resistance protein N-like n=3 Tax=Trifolium pratense TaxID=57577 RepID=A0A2K3MVT2_TRIPR|nr:TMV resistance protein N-like [Trifolium pratense]
MHFLCFFLVLLATIYGIQAVDYSVTNTALSTPGGVRFRDQIGAQYTIHILDSATQFIWNVFHQNNHEDRKNVETVKLFVDDVDGIAYTYQSIHEIHLSARWINNIQVMEEFIGVLYHETTHVWQWFGNNEAPTGLTEGIADYVRLKANYIPDHWVKAGEGDKWDHGYDVTARFLDYCDGLRNGFVADLNKKMRNGYSDQYFVELLGKTPDQLFTDYKAKYGNIA